MRACVRECICIGVLYIIYLYTCNGTFILSLLYLIFAIQVTWIMITNLILTHTHNNGKYVYNEPSLERIRRDSKLVVVREG